MSKATVWRIFPFSHILLRCQDLNVSIQIILHISAILVDFLIPVHLFFMWWSIVLYCRCNMFKTWSPTRWLPLESSGFACRICSYHLCCSGSLNRKQSDEDKILHNKLLQHFCTAETEQTILSCFINAIWTQATLEPNSTLVKNKNTLLKEQLPHLKYIPRQQQPSTETWPKHIPTSFQVFSTPGSKVYKKC